MGVIQDEMISRPSSSIGYELAGAPTSFDELGIRLGDL